eukprot:scaffold233671_cov30-Tisochrysis_lutea.AAC.1
MNNRVVAAISARHGLTPAQTLLAWSAAKGFVPVAKSVHPERIAQGIRAARLLTPGDLDEMAALDCGFRYGVGYMPGHYDGPNSPWSALRPSG